MDIHILDSKDNHEDIHIIFAQNLFLWKKINQLNCYFVFTFYPIKTKLLDLITSSLYIYI